MSDNNGAPAASPSTQPLYIAQSDAAFSHFTLHTNTFRIYSETIAFYQALGCSLVKETTHEPPKHDFGREVFVDKETWLHLFSYQPERSVTLRILLLNKHHRHPTSGKHVAPSGSDAGDASLDSSSICPELTFAVKDIAKFASFLNDSDIKYTTHTDPLTSTPRLALFDPLGTPVFVAAAASTVFSVPGSPVVSPHRTIPQAVLGDANLLEDGSKDAVKPAARNEPQVSAGESKRIGVLTSGGDSQGMNAAVRAVVRMAIVRGCKPYLIYEGYQGLVSGGDKIRSASWNDVSNFLTLGGTLIGTARCMDFLKPEGRRIAVHNLIKHGIDTLVVIGGDGSLTGADTLRHEWPDHVKQLHDDGKISQQEADKYRNLMIVGMVGSIDNDLASTDMTIGASSALTRICESVDSILSTATSHRRAFVVEVMGRHCGWLAMNAAICTGADYLFIPEDPPAGDWETDMCEALKRTRSAGKRTSIVIVAEGAIDDKCNPIKSEFIKDVLTQRLGYDTRVTILGHVQRGGSPTAVDRYLATLQGAEAIEAILRATPDTPSPVIGILENKITTQPLKEAIALTKQVAKAIQDHDFQRAAELRPRSFLTQLETFREIDYYSPEGKDSLPADKRLRIGVIHVGAPAGGMNTATRSVVRLCVNRGHIALGIHNGFPGLMRGEIEVLDWLSVDSWTATGGSKLGTNRDQPDPQLGAIAYQLQRFEIEALIIIGGFEGFTGLLSLTKHRNEYPAFNIPMVLIPATISNNVPGTEFSLGSDTAVNVITNACDAIKLSASSNRKRVFMIEVQGGHSGYLATFGGLAGGATTIYIPEEGITLDRLNSDISHLREYYQRESGYSQGRVVLINEKASSFYSTDIVAKIYEAESGGFYACRSSNLGHLQQGGVPSPTDRVRANTLAVSTVNWIQDQCWKGMEIPYEGNLRLPSTELKRKYRGRVYVPSSRASTVIGILGSQIKFTPIEDLVSETDFKKRKPTKHWWYTARRLVDIVSGVGFDMATGKAKVDYLSCAIDLTAKDLDDMYIKKTVLEKLGN
ncbi:6-phosphofructokinase, alpha subunit [Spiromyces aspiralis]|uniref:6-phosphofructokinase, alpha subunit n=1 Tax=Spiromyces aspiralis TaxID=68401 RepID=A0ACC1HX78_9FUNG|nr:6-phosphofructokinase, alpha subunit [Spiromyces aspiralis]